MESLRGFKNLVVSFCYIGTGLHWYLWIFSAISKFLFLINVIE